MKEGDMMRPRRSLWKDAYLALPLEAIVSWLWFTGHLFVWLALAYSLALGVWFVLGE
ncbi:MAG: hypothetical protein ACYDER_07885 [Ktedonobacteraceae bacterium]